MIMDSTGKSEFIEVNPDEKVRDVKERLANKKGINTDIRIHFNGQFLEDDQNISEYDIQEDEPVIYVAQFRGGK